MFTFREEDGKVPMTWCLKFQADAFLAWKADFAIHLWEGKNKVNYGKVQPVEQQYIQRAYEDVEMAEPVDEDQEEEEAEYSDSDDGQRSDLDEEGSAWARNADGDRVRKNEQLAVGYKSDLSFVTRGNRIGVFAPQDNKLQYRTTIDRIKDLGGKEFAPTKVRVHLRLWLIRADDAAQSGCRYVASRRAESKLHYADGSRIWQGRR